MNEAGVITRTGLPLQVHSASRDTVVAALTLLFAYARFVGGEICRLHPNPASRQSLTDPSVFPEIVVHVGKRGADWLQLQIQTLKCLRLSRRNGNGRCNQEAFEFNHAEHSFEYRRSGRAAAADSSTKGFAGAAVAVKPLIVGAVIAVAKAPVVTHGPQLIRIVKVFNFNPPLDSCSRVVLASAAVPPKPSLSR